MPAVVGLFFGLYPSIKAVALNADGMARATLRPVFEKLLTLEDVQALGPVILSAVRTPSPADKMFSNEIRMGAFKASAPMTGLPRVAGVPP